MTRAPLYRQFRRALLFGVIVLVGYGLIFGSILYDIFLGETPRVGDDYSVFWQALHVVKTEGIARVYDNVNLSQLYAARFGGRPEGVFAAESPYYYLVSRHLGQMAYAWALLFVVGLNLYAWAVTIRLVWPQLHFRGFILAFASGYMFFTLSFGQNGGIIALILAGGFIAQHKNLSRLSGFVASFLMIAPTFLPMFYVLYWVKRDYRAFLTLTIFIALWFYITGWAAGFDVWVTYWQAQSGYIAHLAASESYAYFGSVLGVGLGLGFGAVLLTAVQFAAIFFAVMIYLQAETSKQFSLEFSAFLLGAMLINPYLAHYNMAALTIAAIILMRLLPREHRMSWRFVILFFWIAPVFAAAFFNAIGIPVYFLALLALYGCLWIVLWDRSLQTR